MFYKLNNLIKCAILYKKRLFKLNLNKIELHYVNTLIKLNVIKFIKKNDNTFNKRNMYYVYISYYDNNPIFENIVNMYKCSKPIYITLKNLKKTTFNKNVIIILSTNKGIMTNFEACKNSIGGRIISKILI